MDSVLNSVIVTGVFFVMNAAVGGYLGRFGKPYGALKLAIHIILFLLVLAGIIASVYKLQGVIHDNKLYSTISLYVAGLTLLTNLMIGISMTIIKKVNPKLVLVHKLSTLLMGVSITAGIIFLIVRI